MCFVFVSVTANHCIDPSKNFSESGRIRVGQNSATILYCSLPGEQAIWWYKDKPAVLHNKSTEAEVEASEHMLAIDFAYKSENEGCITVSAEIPHQNTNTESFVELECSTNPRNIVIPIVVEGNLYLFDSCKFGHNFIHSTVSDSHPQWHKLAG